MIGFLFQTLRNIPRLLRVLWVLLRYDVPGALEQAPVLSGQRNPFRFLRFMKAEQGDDGARLVAALKRLGPSYIKLGQVISTRTDLLGDALCEALTELQDRLQGFDGKQAVQIIEEDLGAPLTQLYAEFDLQPISAASVAQVHKAVDLQGEAVAVKVLRPGIEAAFKRDLDFLNWLARIAERIQPKLRPKGIIEVYRQQIAFETDLRLEAAAGAEFKENFASDPRMKLPAIDWSRTGKRVMTQEWVEGASIDDKAGHLANGHSLEQIMQDAAALFFKALFEHGYFHGDQHSGNMFVTADGQIMFVDFGIMGRVSWKSRCFLADLMQALVQRDYQGLAKHYVDYGYLPCDQDPKAFGLAIRAVAEPIIDQPLNKVSFAKLLGQLLQMGDAFGLEAQPEMFLLQKNMLMAEGISRQLTPKLNIWEIAEPLIKAWVIANRTPLHRVLGDLDEGLTAARKLPAMVGQLESELDAMASRRKTSQRRTLLAAIGAGIALTTLWLIA